MMHTQTLRPARGKWIPGRAQLPSVLQLQWPFHSIFLFSHGIYSLTIFSAISNTHYNVTLAEQKSNNNWGQQWKGNQKEETAEKLYFKQIHIQPFTLWNATGTYPALNCFHIPFSRLAITDVPGKHNLECIIQIALIYCVTCLQHNGK